jgi:hypothetical protein
VGYNKANVFRKEEEKSDLGLPESTSTCWKPPSDISDRVLAMGATGRDGLASQRGIISRKLSQTGKRITDGSV